MSEDEFYREELMDEEEWFVPRELFDPEEFLNREQLFDEEEFFDREELFDEEELFDREELFDPEEIPNVFQLRADNYERMQLERRRFSSNSNIFGSDIDSIVETDAISMTSLVIDDAHSAEQNSLIEFPLQCYICKESSFNKTPTAADCGHIFCYNCIESYVQINRKCPVCQKEDPSLIQLYGVEIDINSI